MLLPRRPSRLAVILTLCAAALTGCGKAPSKTEGASAAAATPASTANTPPTTTPAGTAAAPTAASASEAPEAVRKLLGRWLRADGGYSLELRKADMSGVVEAGYFNPKSINVSRAIWMKGPEGLQVVVELNDVGYPGATYVLSHDAQSDRLYGQYTQPAMQQTFDVEFVRQAKP